MTKQSASGASSAPRSKKSITSTAAASPVQAFGPGGRAEPGCPGDVVLHPGGGGVVDALRPAALQRVSDANLEPADGFNLDPQRLAILDRAEPLVIYPKGEHVARLERGDRRGGGDHFGDRRTDIAHGVVMPRLAIHPEPHAQR